MNQKILVKILAVVSAITGVTVLTYVLYPIVSYENLSNQRYPELLSPIEGSSSSDYRSTDFTRASNWFVGGAESQEFAASNISHFTISVPSLSIENATVAIGGEDLTESLIQYPGTSLPGRIGNSVIFGHSILPQFYNPEDYLAIFSTLPTLVQGDEIFINFDGVSYTYRVVDLFEVRPTDLRVLDQDENDSYISLITCTPPGHPLKPKRLVVRAKVVPPSI